MRVRYLTTLVPTRNHPNDQSAVTWGAWQGTAPYTGALTFLLAICKLALPTNRKNGSSASPKYVIGLSSTTCCLSEHIFFIQWFYIINISFN